MGVGGTGRTGRGEALLFTIYPLFLFEFLIDQLFLVIENSKREFQQGTLRLNIRQNFTTGRIASRVERLPGVERK